MLFQVKTIVGRKYFVIDYLWKPVFDSNSSQTPSNLIFLTILVTLKSFTLSSCKFFNFFTEHFFTKHLWWLLLQRLSTKKYFKRKCFYITICMFYVLLVGFQKKKKKRKKSGKVKKGCQKSWGFCSKYVFPTNRF